MDAKELGILDARIKAMCERLGIVEPSFAIDADGNVSGLGIRQVVHTLNVPDEVWLAYFLGQALTSWRLRTDLVFTSETVADCAMEDAEATMALFKQHREAD